MPKPQSLRTQLLLRLTLPLALVVLLDGAVSYFLALNYANVAYDRWLLDSAHSLAQEVKARRDKVTFDLPPIALEVFRWDDEDLKYFKIASRRDGFMAGDKAVPEPPDWALAEQQPYYFDGNIQGKKIRIVSMLMAPTETSDEVLVEVAETLNKRRAMMGDILLAVVVPQLLLLLITAIHIWKGVNQGLRPLHTLARLIASRSSKDLEPVPDSGVPMEVRSLTHTINDLLHRLAQSMAAQNRFIENAAHQLRTPLAGLKIQAERALRSQDLDGMRPALQAIKRSADRVSHLSTQLLVLARSEPVMEGMRRFRPLDLTGLARECCMDWVPRALERDMDLGFEAPDDAILIHGDETLLRELLNNLLDNAVQYGRAGGQIAVKLSALPRPLLVVEDDGPGIPAAEWEKVFERFYRIQGSVGEGCGLGLSIVQEIAHAHGASVRLGGGADGGLCIQVNFAPFEAKNEA